jgi:hypothetical protein
MARLSDRGWRKARRKALRQLATMTDEEDAEIRAGIAADPDAFEMTEEMWARMRPAVEMAPEIVAAYRRWRKARRLGPKDGKRGITEPSPRARRRPPRGR